ncbi:hypothetical protein HPB49_015016 [Dermacentor silvarum]|uniref:Uncharacterized protein n=1 Tax=Dermacentor silvarum TaxID=543639 RepID=A0ACB8DE54_DERSI|nr:hypothetical protein HPB49_015016 [Dermacentor silvarum]
MFQRWSYAVQKWQRGLGRRDCEGTMDIVWDRGGLVSVREEDRGRYVALLKSLLARNFSYALYTTEYDDTGFQVMFLVSSLTVAKGRSGDLLGVGAVPQLQRLAP